MRYQSSIDDVVEQRQRMYEDGERARRAMARQALVGLTTRTERRERARQRLIAHNAATSGHGYPSAARRLRYARRERLVAALKAAKPQTRDEAQTVLRWAR